MRYIKLAKRQFSNSLADPGAGTPKRPTIFLFCKNRS